MEFLSAGLGIIGLGMSIFGAMDSADISQHQADVSRDEAKQEQGINDQKQQQMETEARRQKLEITRNMQRKLAMSEAAATNQGAQFGSGLAGGQAQITDQSYFNEAGVNSSLEIGRNINQYNQSITNDKYQMAQLGGDMATANAFTSLGGSIMKAGPMVGALSGGFGKVNLTGFGFNPIQGVSGQ